jgi:S-formylglutathione hydrolase
MVRLVALCMVISAVALAQSPTKGAVERIKVHGRSLEGNLIGDSPERDVSIYLPPSYRTQRSRRYPVLYMLHGFTDDDARWFGHVKHWISLPEVLDKSLADPAVREMIVVMPNAHNTFQGSMYSTSVTIGDWESYVARELVTHIDRNYRTLAQPASRGLAGHSMGGYGTIRIAMKHPGVFSAIYLLNPCCMAAGGGPRGGGPSPAEAVRSAAEIEKANFGVKAQLASAASWSPNPKNPPLFLDLPTKNGEPQPAVLAKWAANAPLAMIDQYLPNLRRLTGIAFDAGTQETGIAATVRTLGDVLTMYGVEHTAEVYEGNHTNRVAERIETKVMPFFSQKLAFERVRSSR